MENTTLNYNELNNALQGFINDLAETYKSLLIRDGKSATGNLINSITPSEIFFDGKSLSGDLSLASYWKYVEYGRKPGKFPPPDTILSWVQHKNILPRPGGLKKNSDKQITFLISRKIAKYGIPPGNQLQEAINIVWERWKDTISDAITQDLQYALG